MCKEHLIARGTVHAFLSQKESFSFHEVQDEIIRRNGIMRVSMGVTVIDYLNECENRGLVHYRPIQGRYKVEKRDSHR